MDQTKSEDLEKQLPISDVDNVTKQIIREQKKRAWTWKDKTWKERLRFLISKEFLRVLFLGQRKEPEPSLFLVAYLFISRKQIVLSLCITGTTVTSTELSNRYDFNAPTTQSFLV